MNFCKVICFYVPDLVHQQNYLSGNLIEILPALLANFRHSNFKDFFLF